MTIWGDTWGKLALETLTLPIEFSLLHLTGRFVTEVFRLEPLAGFLLEQAEKELDL